MNASRTLRAVPTMMIAAVLLAGCASVTTAANSPSTPPSVGATVPASPASPGSEPPGTASPGSEPPGTSSPGTLCASFDDLKTSITDLRSINVVSGGVAAVQQAVTNVRTKLDAFQASARTDFGPQVTQMKTALSGVQTALSAATATPGVKTIAGVAASIVGVVSAYNSLHSAVSSRCS